MSDQLFEVAFSGKISDGANADDVKAKVGKMFNADEGKLAQLFSGKRIVIKKNIDQATASKYKTALNRAGAKCEVKSVGGDETAAIVPPPKPAAATAVAGAVSQEYETQYDGDVAPPPQFDPLGITSEQIEDLSASLAPVVAKKKQKKQARPTWNTPSRKSPPRWRRLRTHRVSGLSPRKTGRPSLRRSRSSSAPRTS